MTNWQAETVWYVKGDKDNSWILGISVIPGRNVTKYYKISYDDRSLPVITEMSRDDLRHLNEHKLLVDTNDNRLHFIARQIASTITFVGDMQKIVRDMSATKKL